MPPSTERARTLATRSGTAAVLVAALGRTAPTLHHVHQDGTTIVMLPSDHPLTMQAEPRADGGLSAMIELTDTAPVASSTAAPHPLSNLTAPWASCVARVPGIAIRFRIAVRSHRW